MSSKKKEDPPKDEYDLQIEKLQERKKKLEKLKQIAKLEAEIKELEPKGPIDRFFRRLQEVSKK